MPLNQEISSYGGQGLERKVPQIDQRFFECISRPIYQLIEPSS